MRIYNTQSGTKEELQTLNPPEVKIYVCGPTTYNYIHLGNARPLVTFDCLRRFLDYRGYKVKYIQNFTDVDDKIIKKSQEEGLEPLKLAEKYIEEYFIDADALGIRRADVHPRVSENITEIIAMIEGLIKKGYAYAREGDVYYRVRAFKNYGKLSGRSLEDMLAGARVEVNELKEDASDFVLWKAAKSGEPHWDSPWGQGRPGWHIECSAMSMKYLGETIDIHGGGADLIFPHHENEVAQSEAFTGMPFANYWMHNGFITVNNEKMSKSLGNFFILRDILKKYPADVVRFYLLANHYRSPLDFDDSKLEEARKALGRLKNTRLLLEEFLDISKIKQSTDISCPFIEKIKQLKDKFIEAMNDDLNTAKAIGEIFEIAHAINIKLSESQKDNSEDQSSLSQVAQIYHELGDVLGIFLEVDNNQKDILPILNLILELRQRARQEKDFATADQIRDALSSWEIFIEDHADGNRVRYEQEISLDTIMMNVLIPLRQHYRQKKDYKNADFIRDNLKDNGIIIEDTKEGVRWKLVNES